jgi:hypothetical protein
MQEEGRPRPGIVRLQRSGPRPRPPSRDPLGFAWLFFGCLVDGEVDVRRRSHGGLVQTSDWMERLPNQGPIAVHFQMEWHSL